MNGGTVRQFRAMSYRLFDVKTWSLIQALGGLSVRGIPVDD
jgi:hypothetical protein